MADPFSITAGIISVLQLAQAIGLYAYSFEGRPMLCRRVAAEVAAVDGLMRQIQHLDQVLRDQHEWRAQIQHLAPLLKDLVASLTNLDSKMKDLSIAPKYKLLAWPAHESTIKNLLDTLVQQKDSVMSSLQLHQVSLCQIVYRQSRSIDQKLDTLCSCVSEILRNNENLLLKTISSEEDHALLNARKEREEVLTWITSVSFMSEHDDLRQNCVENTGQWLLQHPVLQKWKESNTTLSSQVLLVLGNPGCGKTMLASTLIESLKIEEAQAESPLISFVYCSSKVKARAHPETLVASLLQQVCQATSELEESVIQLRERYRITAHTKPSFSELLKTLLAVTKRMISTRVCYFVVDGFDECEDPRILADIVNKLSQLSPTAVKLAVFSRPSCDALPLNAARITITPSANSKDIERFATAKLRKLSQHCKPLQNGDLNSFVIQYLLQNAAGMFLWVSLQADNLASKPTQKSMRNAIQSLPVAIDEVFERQLEQISTQPAEIQDFAIRTLQWALNARRSVHISEMVEAIAIDDSTSELGPEDLVSQDRLMNYCADLVVLDQTGFVQILHLSLRTALESIIQRKTKLYELVLRISQHRELDMVRTCLAYLNLDRFRGSKQCDDIEQLLQSNPFLSYVAQHWAEHVRNLKGATSIVEQKILELVSDEMRMDLLSRVIRHRLGNESLRQNSIGKQKRNALHHLAENGLHQFLGNFDAKRLSDMSAQHDVHGFLPLDLALVNCHREICKSLLGIESKESRWYRPTNNKVHRLHMMVSYGWYDEVKLFLSLRARLNEFDALGYTPLHVACHHNRLEILKTLLEAGSDVDEKSLHEDSTGMMIAAGLGHFDIVRYLLMQQADVEARNCFNATAVHIAAGNGCVEVLTLILDSHPDLQLANLADAHQSTPIFDAIANGHIEVVAQLLALGASYQHTDLGGSTPLHVAAAYQQRAIFALLLQEGSQLLCRDDNGWTALQVMTFLEPAWTKSSQSHSRLACPAEAFNEWDCTKVHDILLHEFSTLVPVKTTPTASQLLEWLRSASEAEQGKNVHASPLHAAAAASDSTVALLAILRNSECDIWKQDPWGRTAYDLAIGEIGDISRQVILSAAQRQNSPRPCNIPDTHPELVNLNHQLYLPKRGWNFCPIIRCDKCKRQMENTHFLHCKLCSFTGEGWDICSQCYCTIRSNSEDFCSAGHSEHDLQLMFVANHMISGPTITMESLWLDSLDDG